MLPIFAFTPERLQRSIPDHDGGIDPHTVGAKRDEFPCRGDIGLRIAAGKARHHLRNEMKTMIPHQGNSAYRVRRGVTAPGIPEHRV